MLLNFMKNITTKIPRECVDFIDAKINSGAFGRRSNFICEAVKKLIAQCEVDEIFQASLDSKTEEVFSGDLDELIKIHI